MYDVLIYQDIHFRVEFDQISRCMYGIFNEDISNWIAENIKSPYCWLDRAIHYDNKKKVVIGVIRFKNEEDAVAFKLAW